MNQSRSKKTLPNLSFEKRYRNKGFKYIAGADEVGRGCFAGPVVAAAVIFQPNHLKTRNLIPDGVIIDDSKKLIAKQREVSDKWIRQNCAAYGVGKVSAKVINKVGMGKASQMAFRRAVTNCSSHLGKRVDFLLIDHFYIPYVRGLPAMSRKARRSDKLKDSRARQLAITNGDGRCLSIAAASIIAKVYRDKLMVNLSEKPRYKRYNWSSNKGYATIAHRSAIKGYGITGYHRKQFVKNYLSKNQ